MSNKVHIYSNGICYCSVCAPKKMKIEEVERQVNLNNPSGVGPWKLSEDKKFSSGEPMPRQCEDNRDRLHYLFVC